MATRLRLTAQQKTELRLQYPECYVCGSQSVQHAALAGYDLSQIEYDHLRPVAAVGDTQADQIANFRPIHAASGGATIKDLAWAHSASRNCHQGKSNTYTGEEWCDYVRVYQRALATRFSDDLMPNRDPNADTMRVDINWNDQQDVATFLARDYPLMRQDVGDRTWRSFSTLVPPGLLWKDNEVQSRSATAERLAQFAWHLRSNPLLSPILCRVRDRQLLVFDGNHRLCAFILARGDGTGNPVTIFDGPAAEDFLSVVAEAHDTLTQLKYQYTAKALKFSALTSDDIERAAERYGDKASEVLAWEGQSPKNVKLRVIGGITHKLDDAGGWREKWIGLGISDASWVKFLETYAKTGPEVEPFSSDGYRREDEQKNLAALCAIFDEELFDRLPQAGASLKTKWWKRAHFRFRNALAQLVKHSLSLGNMPEYPAYTAEWNAYIRGEIRSAVTKWRQSGDWTGSTTANNEPDIDKVLNSAGFTEAYLMDS